MVSFFLKPKIMDTFLSSLCCVYSLEESQQGILNEHSRKQNVKDRQTDMDVQTVNSSPPTHISQTLFVSIQNIYQDLPCNRY